MSNKKRLNPNALLFTKPLIDEQKDKHDSENLLLTYHNNQKKYLAQFFSELQSLSDQ